MALKSRLECIYLKFDTFVAKSTHGPRMIENGHYRQSFFCLHEQTLCQSGYRFDVGDNRIFPITHPSK